MVFKAPGKEKQVRRRSGSWRSKALLRERHTKADMALDTNTGSLLPLSLRLLLSSRYMQASKTNSSNCFGEKVETFVYTALKQNLLNHYAVCLNMWRKLSD